MRLSPKTHNCKRLEAFFHSRKSIHRRCVIICMCFIVIQNQGVVPDAANKLGIKKLRAYYLILHNFLSLLLHWDLLWSWKPVYKTRLRARALFINGRAHSRFFLPSAHAVQLADVLNFVSAESRQSNQLFCARLAGKQWAAVPDEWSSQHLSF